MTIIEEFSFHCECFWRIASCFIEGLRSRTVVVSLRSLITWCCLFFQTNCTGRCGDFEQTWSCVWQWTYKFTSANQVTCSDISALKQLLFHVNLIFCWKGTVLFSFCPKCPFSCRNVNGMARLLETKMARYSTDLLILHTDPDTD